MDERLVRQAILSSSNDEKRIYRSRIQKFSKSHTLYVILLAALAFLQVVAIAFFAKGFLLSRQVLDNVSVASDVDRVGQKFDKMVVLVVDALRFDFVVPVAADHPQYNPYYHNNLDVLYNTWSDPSLGSSILLKFMADPPTTTLQRLKGLTTGSLPTFIDAGSNFDGSVIEEDNLIKQLYLNNKSISFVGDDTWDALFHPFLANNSEPFESLNVWDLDTVDNGVISYFHSHLLDPGADRNWDVLVGHMLGVDHVGHKYGPNHFTMKEKQTQVNQFIKEIIDSLDKDTLLVVMGDHGMDHTGNHGGDSEDELESTLFMYSKKKNVWGLRDDEHYDTSDLGKNYRQVNQIDLVPTLSLLMGTPIPFNNLGWPIRETFKDEKEELQLSNIVLQQLKRYSDIMQISTSEDNEVYMNELWNMTSTDINSATLYQEKFLEICKDKWARFDYWSIASGTILLTVSVVLLFSITKLIPSIVVNQMVPEFVPWIIIMSLISNVCFHGIFYVFHQPLFLDNVWWCTLFATAIGIIVGCSISIFDRYNLIWLIMKFGEILSDYWSRIGAMFVGIHSMLFTSNSFTIWEDRIVSVLIITFGMLTLYEFTFLPNRQSTSALLTAAIGEKQGTTSGASKSTANSNYLPLTRFARLLGAYHSITLILCTRLASTITICREEQGEYCIPTFTTKNNYSAWCIGLCLLIVLLIPICIKGYYNLSSSYQAAAPIWIDMFLKGTLFVNFIYWSITAIENSTEDLTWDTKTVKFTIARIIAGFSLIATNIGWMMGPLCIKLNIKNADLKSNQATILGYTNIYGSEFFLLVVNALMAIILFNKPMAQLSLFLMVNQLLSIFEIIDLLKLKENIVGPIVLGLVGYQQFFSTGHQATIPSIQWDVGFILSENIVFPFTHLAIFLNTFGPLILVSLSVALLTLWSQPPDVLKPQTLLGRIVSNCGVLLTYNTILCLSSFIWVTHFRRHLMVWKIFCPRFIFASLSLIVVQLTITFGTIGFASGRLIKHINDIFWR
ncbi:GPI ethanolamine phosphate transferase 3 [Nakaseomyces bracarensis]|uniref:GPI ethanolamine phosphate transferase 3 n=1 Tax=Nakaseomyces bracarensis TaxID=273131 RepID=A0ABR4NTM5_9SACH